MDLLDLVAELDNQMVSIGEAMQSMQAELTKWEDMESLVDGIVGELEEGSMTQFYIKDHLNKIMGANGSYGIRANKEAISNSLATMEKDLTKLQYLSDFYSAWAKERELPLLPEWVESDPDSLDHNPDFVYINRGEPPIPWEEGGTFDVGSTCVIESKLYIFTHADTEYDHAGWECVGDQTDIPEDPNGGE